MQSLRSGMVLLKVDSPSQDIVVGIVLVAAVGHRLGAAAGRRRMAVGALAVGLAVTAVVIQTGRPERGHA